MAANCDICNKTLRLFDESFGDWLINHTVSVCKSCHSNLLLLKDHNLSANSYFSDILSNQRDIHDEIKSELAELIDEASGKESPTKQLNKTIQKLSDKNISSREKETILLTTTGDTISGYTIDTYCGVLSYTVVIGSGFLSELSASISDTLGERDEMFEDKISTAKDIALNNLMIKAIKIHANAIIGINFDLAVTKTNMFLISVTGTAVEVNPTIQN